MKTLFGLPKKVVFCKKSLISNQRPSSAIEFKHNKKSKKKTLYIDNRGVSDSWKYSRKKLRIDFKKREKILLKLLDKHRGKYGEFDCIVPGSGGKDSCYASHILKFKYGMNPLTVTWPPILYTDYGYKNYKNWLNYGEHQNIKAKRSEKAMIALTRLSILNLMHPFQTFMLGQKIWSVKMASKFKIPLVFFGENEAEHGNAIADNYNSIRKSNYFSSKDLDKVYLGGEKYKTVKNMYNFKDKELEPFLPIPSNELSEKLEVHYLGYYLKWIPQECYYYAVENCGFRPRPFRTQGTYSKYNSIDDKIDDLHFYTTYIKFGIGRATYDASQEIRNNHISIDEGKKLIKKYDGEFPDRYFNETLKYLGIKKDIFFKAIDKFRSPHLWKKVGKIWKLRHTVNKDGTDD